MHLGNSIFKLKPKNAHNDRLCNDFNMSTVTAVLGFQLEGKNFTRHVKISHDVLFCLVCISMIDVLQCTQKDCLSCILDFCLTVFVVLFPKSEMKTFLVAQGADTTVVNSGI